MTTMAVERIFIDTNVLVRANVASAPLHAEALHADGAAVSVVMLQVFHTLAP